MMRRKRNICSRLRQKFTLQEEIRTPDNVGGYLRSWKNVTNLWAEIIPMTGHESLMANQLESRLTHKVTLRYRKDVTTSHRLVFGNSIYNIRSVINSGYRNEQLELLVEEGVAT